MKKGDVVAGYELVEPAGRGAAGEVWKAIRDGKTAAVKVAAGGDGFLLRVESASLRKLDHPNIVRVLDAGPDYVVSEWVDSAPPRGALEEAQARSVASQILQALRHAHGRGVIHGDLKPANVLVTAGGTAKVCDFAYGRRDTSVRSSLYAGAEERKELVGSVGYLAPEVVQGDEPDERSDLYSFGVLLYELLTGRLPPALTPPGRVNPRLDPAWDGYLARLLADREKRFASAEEALDCLPPVAPRAPFWKEAWFAGPMFIVSIFLAAYVALGMTYLQPSLRVLALAAAVLLGALFGRSVAAPLPTALFWGGLFWAYAARALHIGLMLAGVAACLAGAALYFARIRKKRRNGKAEISPRLHGRP